MWSVVKYFVLTLFFEAVVSSPYYVPSHSGHEDLYNEERHGEAFLSRTRPSYMSPLPTQRDEYLDEEILDHSRNLRRPKNIDYHRVVNDEDTSKKNYDDELSEYISGNEYRQAASTKYAEQVNNISNNVVVSPRNYANPTTIDQNEILSHLLRQNRAVDNDFISKLTGEPNYQQQQIDDAHLEVLRHYYNNKYDQPLKIKAVPEQRIAFQVPIDVASTKLSNLESYRPATPVNGFNIDREWSNISREPAELPVSIAELLKYPVDVQSIKPNSNKKNHDVSNHGLPEHDIQKIIQDKRIQNILSSTKQIKRFLVVHPNGTVEHLDSLEPIAEQHPGFVLVKAEYFARKNNNNEATRVENENQQQASSQNFTSLLTESDSAEVQPPIKVVKDSITKEPTLLTIVSSSKETHSVTFEPTVASSSTITVDKLSPTTLEPDNVTENIKSSLDKDRELTDNKQSTDVTEESDIDKSSTSEIADENTKIKNSNDKRPIDTETSIPETTDKTTSEISTNKQENNSTETTISGIEVISISANATPIALENKPEDDNNSTILVTQNEENIDELSQAQELKELDSSRSGKPVMWFNTSDPEFWQKVTDGKDSNIVYFFIVSSSPRIEKETRRTVYPDGAILEELIETVWEREGAEPVVTKTSKLIHPDDVIPT